MLSEMSRTNDVSPDAKPVISVEGLGKCYRMYEKPSHRLWQGLTGRGGFHKDFWALRGVDVQIMRGETFGVIGKNGSGKSTFLQMVAGTLTPTEGSLRVDGRVAALLELGSGFNPEFTGRENVYLNATILGLARSEIDKRMQGILEFADIGDFIDQPVRSYSSGMTVRLAFAVIVHVDADILIIDEALSVGDAFFSQKCMRFLREFQKTGTLMFVSHDAAAVTNLCSRAVWLEDGTVRMMGPAQAVVESYMTQQHVVSRSNLAGETVVVDEKLPLRPQARPTGEDFRKHDFENAGVLNRISLFEFDPDHTGVQFGSGLAKIEDVAFLDEQSTPLKLTAGGELARLRITFRLLEDLDDLIAGFYVKDRLGQRLFGDNTHFSQLHAPISGRKGDVFHAEFRFRLPLMPQGSYMIDAAIASGSQDDHTQQHWIYDAIEFKAIDKTMRFGLVGIPMLGIEVSKGMSG